MRLRVKGKCAGVGYGRVCKTYECEFESRLPLHNKRKRMVKSIHGNHAGNVNMKGKKYKLMRCRCCVCLDFRDRELKKEHRKEMKEAKNELDCDHS